MSATGFVTFLFDLLAAAEQKTSLAACLCLWNAGLHEFFHVLLNMEAQFFVELAVDSGAIKKRAKARTEVGEDVMSAEHVHCCVPYAVSRICATAMARAFHWSASVSSCL